MTAWDADVLVAGGGISGLAAAWWLGQAGLEVELRDGRKRLGGKIRTDQAGGYTTERSATLILNFRSEVDALLRGSGLEAVRLPRAPAPNRYIAWGGRMQAAPASLPGLIRSPLLSLRGKLRLGLEPFIPGREASDETVAAFVTRRFGREIYERGFEPYIAGPLASDAERAEARAVLPRLTAMESQYGSIGAALARRFIGRGPRRTAAQSFSFVGGMSTLVATLANAPGVHCVTGCEVVAIEPGRHGWLVHGSDGTQLNVRHVVLGISAAHTAGLLEPFAPEAAGLLREVEYAPISVAHLGFARAAVGHPLDGTGVLFGRSERRAPTGCLWTSRLLPERAPADGVLLDCYLGGARLPRAAHWDENRVVDACMDALAPLLKIRGMPEWLRIDRHPDGLPLYHRGHLARMAALDHSLAPCAGLHLAGNYRDGISVRDRIVAGQALAGKIVPTPVPRRHSSWANHSALRPEPVR